MKNFEGFGLSDALNKSLTKMDYTTPTPIQAQAIPLALKGRDVLGSAQTGTGKTAAFSIPLVESLLRNPQGTALVLTPTRELAKQVLDVIHQLLGYKSPIKTAFIIGGESMGKQLQQLQAKPRIIVGTPGRINDHLERGTINFKNTGFLVLDETDRMLDMGFGVQIDRITKHLPKQRQTLMFSATMPNNIIKMSSKYLNKPERISVGETNVIAKNIQTDVIRIDQSEKYKELTNQLYDRKGSVIVFIKTKYGADRMAKNLRRDGFTSEALHGDLRQNKRDKVMQNFRKQNFRILIATDIAARGLDVPHIEHVVNYDLPQVAEDYIHRMGRTARAGAEGSALCFVSPQDGRKWHAIECLLDPDAKRAPAPKESKRGRKAPYRGRPSAKKAGNDGYKKDSKKRDNRKFSKRDDHKDDTRSDDKKSYGKKKPYGKKPFRKNSEESQSEGKKSFGKKSYGKKPYAGKSDETQSEDKKPFAKRSPKKKSYGAKKDAKRQGTSKKKPYVSKNGSKPMKRTFRDKPKTKKAA